MGLLISRWKWRAVNRRFVSGKALSFESEYGLSGESTGSWTWRTSSSTAWECLEARSTWVRRFCT
jgi:hypothetical protein